MRNILLVSILLAIASMIFGQANLTIEIIDGPTEITMGEIVTHTVRITNVGDEKVDYFYFDMDIEIFADTFHDGYDDSGLEAGSHKDVELIWTSFQAGTAELIASVEWGENWDNYALSEPLEITVLAADYLLYLSTNIGRQSTTLIQPTDITVQVANMGTKILSNYTLQLWAAPSVDWEELEEEDWVLVVNSATGAPIPPFDWEVFEFENVTIRWTPLKTGYYRLMARVLPNTVPVMNEESYGEIVVFPPNPTSIFSESFITDLTDEWKTVNYAEVEPGWQRVEYNKPTPSNVGFVMKSEQLIYDNSVHNGLITPEISLPDADCVNLQLFIMLDYETPENEFYHNIDIRFIPSDSEYGDHIGWVTTDEEEVGALNKWMDVNINISHLRGRSGRFEIQHYGGYGAASYLIDSIIITHWEPQLNDNDFVVIPSSSLLRANYPNPFNPTTTISYYIETDQEVSIDIFNIKGQKVKNLVNGYKTKGDHKVVWNGQDEKGNNVGSGVYFYRMKAGEYQATQKMLMIK